MAERDQGDHQYTGTYSRMVIDQVRLGHGDAGVDETLARSGLEDQLEQLTDDTSWVSYDHIRRLFEAAAIVLGSPQELSRLWMTFEVAAGTIPDRAGVLLTLGTPESVLADLDAGNMAMSNIETTTFTEQVGPSTWHLGRHLDDGYEPFEELCEFTMGATAAIPAMFGYTSIKTEEVTCQRRGDYWCTIRLSWDDNNDEERAAAFVLNKLAVIERRLAAFQSTVADIVATDDLATTLRRITDAAGVAVRVPQFVLALDPLPWHAQLAYGFNLSASEAADIASRPPAHDDLVVEVASGNRHHGRLIAVGGTTLVQDSMRAQIRAYAQLAATAIEGALAVEEATRQAATAKLLLELATRLALIGSMEELAERLVEVVPALVGSDRAIFGVIDELGRGTMVALEGYDPEEQALLLSSPMVFEPRPHNGIDYATIEEVEQIHQQAGELMRSTHSVACVNVPIVVDDKLVGWITSDVTHDAPRLHPSQELEERLIGLAAQAATAMRNALLLDRVSHQAEHDTLTGLPNRNLFVDRLSAAETQPSVLFVDIDDFKNVNDGLGHESGDLLLCEVGERLRLAVREDDMVARFGGDEFAVIVFDPMPGAAEQVARRVIEAFDRPFDLAGHQVTVSASVGLASDSTKAEDLLRNADIAMYRAKAAGKGRVARFEPGMDHAASERLALHADLTEAIERDQLVLLYQPVLDLDDGTMHSAEALVRWEHPKLGLLSPMRFIGLAEETGLIGALGAWVLEEACREATTWPEHMSVAVNLSPRQLEHDGIVAEIADILHRVGLAPDRLVLEVTENVLARNPDAMIPRLEALQELGARIAIDDFGTGYSSLGVLINLPVDILKIDRVFITQMCSRPGAADLVQVLIDMGATLGLDVVAEGIEEVEELQALQERHCKFGQGFLYSPPVSAAEFRGFLAPAPGATRPALLPRTRAHAPV